MTERKPKVRSDGEGTIYPVRVTLKAGQQRTYYKASVRHEGRRITLSSTSKTETGKRLKKLLRDLEDGSPTGRSRQTVIEFVNDWLESSVKPTVRPRTYLAYRERLHKHILPTLGRMK